MIEILHCKKKDISFIYDRLVDYNIGKLASVAYQPDVDLSIMARVDGKIVGGIEAYMYYLNAVYVDIVYVDDSYRNQGIGAMLIDKLEEEALALGANMVHFDTFDFQAKDFYLKHGYEVFGVLEGYECGCKRYYMRKMLK